MWITYLQRSNRRGGVPFLLICLFYGIRLTLTRQPGVRPDPQEFIIKRESTTKPPKKEHKRCRKFLITETDYAIVLSMRSYPGFQIPRAFDHCSDEFLGMDFQSPTITSSKIALSVPFLSYGSFYPQNRTQTIEGKYHSIARSVLYTMQSIAMLLSLSTIRINYDLLRERPIFHLKNTSFFIIQTPVLISNQKCLRQILDML